MVIARGTPFRAKSDANGNFDLPGVPSGKWTLHVTHPLAAADLWRLAGSNSGQVTDVGIIRLKGSGSIRGRGMFLNPDDQATAGVGVPGRGIAPPTKRRGGYVLGGGVAGDPPGAVHPP